MNEQEVLQILEELRTGNREEYLVTKEQFMFFRSILMKQKDRTHFVGHAQKGGHVIYKYRAE